MLRKGRNHLLDHPTYSCNDVSVWMSTTVPREHHLVPRRVQQEVHRNTLCRCMLKPSVSMLQLSWWKSSKVATDSIERAVTLMRRPNNYYLLQ